MKKSHPPLMNFLVFAVLIIAGTLGAHGPKGQAASKVRETKDTAVVTNEDKTQGPPLFLRFEDDLSISQEAWTPWDLFVDDEDNIFVFAGREWILKKFDSRGAEVSSKPFRKGQRPGEFQMIDADFTAAGLLTVYDGPQRRLTILNKNYEVLKIQKMGFWGLVFELDSKRNMVFLDIRFLPTTRDQNRLVLTKHAPSGEILFEMAEYLWGPIFDRLKGKYKDELFRPQLKYAIDSRDNIYYAMSDKYEIHVVSPEGNLIKKIIKKGASRKVTQKDIDQKMAFYPPSSRARYEIVVPEHMPRIAGLFILENGYLLVITFESALEAKSLVGDVFDEKGIYRARVEVPVYAGWDDLVQPRKGWARSKNNRFYTIESDEAGENYFIKRYKMIWGKSK
jgi:hypothetical protein